jgi:cytochrome c-type biogenesis protein CcmE
VAAALAIFVVYTALAGNGVAQVTPSTVAGHAGNVTLVGKVVGSVKGNQYAHSGMRFAVEDIGGKAARVPVVYHGDVPDLFKTGRDIVVAGTLSNGVFVAKRNSLITKCPSKYTSKT